MIAATIVTLVTPVGAQGLLISDKIALVASEIVFRTPGFAHVAGVVASYDFPGIDSGTVTNAGFGLRYVAKVDLATRKPTWVSVVGAPSKEPSAVLQDHFATDEVRGFAVHTDGAAYLVAYDGSKNFPVSGGTYELPSLKYVFRVSATGQVTRFSGPLDPAIRRVGAIALDSSGNIYLTGSADSGLQTSASAPFPANSVAPGCIAPFILKLDAAGQSTLYATYLGYAGTQGERCGEGSGVFDPTGFDLAVDAAGNAVVGGQAEPGVRATLGSPDSGSKTPTLYVPTAKAFASHAFVSKVNASGSAIVFTARLGGSYKDRVTSVAMDASGAVFVGGKTSSNDFPTTSYFGSLFPFSYRTCPGFPNAPEMGFVAKLSPDGTQLLFSGFVPMVGDQLANCGGNPTARFAPLRIALDGQGRLFASGPTDSTRDYVAPPNAIPTLSGSALLYIIAADGRSVEYFSSYAGLHPRGAAIDPWGNFWVASDTLLRFSPGTTPVEIINPLPLCASGGTLIARVAGANDFGSAEFFVDGISAGSASIANSLASHAVVLAPGVRRVLATYHGASYFDGYSSDARFLAVNQAGACQ